MTDPGTLATQVLWAVFALGIVFGAVAQRTHFCTMGAVADIVVMGDWSRMRMWVLAMAVAVLGFNAMAAAGVIDAADSLYGSPRLVWLSHLVGGLLFGVGMVLGSGCGSKTLVRLGGGNLKSLVVFLVVGLSAFATLRGLTAVLRVETVDRLAVDLGAGQDLPSLVAAWTGLDKRGLALFFGAAVAALLGLFALVRPEGRSANNLIGGIGTGLVIAAVWWVSGVWGHVPEHPDTLQEAFVATASGRMESLSFVAPIAHTLDWLMFFSDKSKVLSLGVVACVGVVAGSAVMALLDGSFRWEGFRGPEDTALHVVGGVLMGVGGVTALGCTVGQGVSALSTLALGSVLSLAGIFAGAVVALRWQMGRA